MVHMSEESPEFIRRRARFAADVAGKGVGRENHLIFERRTDGRIPGLQKRGWIRKEYRVFGLAGEHPEHPYMPLPLAGAVRVGEKYILFRLEPDSNSHEIRVHVLGKADEISPENVTQKIYSEMTKPVAGTPVKERAVLEREVTAHTTKPLEDEEARAFEELLKRMFLLDAGEVKKEYFDSLLEKIGEAYRQVAEKLPFTEPESGLRQARKESSAGELPVFSGYSVLREILGGSEERMPWLQFEALKNIYNFQKRLTGRTDLKAKVSGLEEKKLHTRMLSTTFHYMNTLKRAVREGKPAKVVIMYPNRVNVE